MERAHQSGPDEGPVGKPRAAAGDHIGRSQPGWTQPGWIAVCIAALVAGAPAAAAPAEQATNTRLEALQRQLDELRVLQEQVQEELRGLRAQTAMRAPEPSAERLDPVVGAPRPQFGGQYRINSYTSDNDRDGESNQAAARVRLRQNVDLAFDERFDTHLQLELGHTTGNVGTTGRGTLNNDNPGTGELRVRHAVLRYRTAGDIRLEAGILPLSDRFGDTLFSADWDYNPVALSGSVPLGDGDLRLAVARLSEGSETRRSDDFDHYQADYDLAFGGAELTFGASWLRPASAAAATGGRSDHVNYGLGLSYPLNAWSFDAFILGSRTDRSLLGAASSGSGVALKMALEGPLGPGRLGLLLTHASGDSDGSGFLPVMALAGTYGYWGHTGILTAQGPTDTGFDGDAVNISNNGYGLTSAQARYSFPIADRLDGQVAAGWFGNTDAPAGRDSAVGIDLLLMGTWRFNDVLSLDFGAAWAQLEDSVSGYTQGAAGAFNQAVGDQRDKRALFSRLQAEF